MWTSLSGSPESVAPSSRTKHSATLLGGHVYLLGGRNGNVPLKDMWKYSLADGKWEQLNPTGDKPPCLQEHTAVAYKDCIYVYGGEVGFSAATETPLWIYNVKANTWRKIKGQKGVSVPKGRRGHSALVHKGSMLLYGGYQDLRGSSNELWAFHFETESWHLFSPTCSADSTVRPLGRHKHSAVLHDEAMWIYGGMTDLQERGDLWRWDTVSKVWTNIKTKISPGSLHSHAACKLPSSMLMFGGESNGQPSNELWRFHFGTETWEKLQFPGTKPQPRAESIALPVSDLLLQDNHSETTSVVTMTTTTTVSSRGPHRTRGGGSMDRCKAIGNNKICPVEKKYVFSESGRDYVSGNLVSSRRTVPEPEPSNFLKEITKLSSINLSRLNHKCSYSVLNSSHDSTESLLKTKESSDSENTPTRMVKSQSANVIAKRKSVNALSAATPAGDKMPYSIVESAEFSFTDSDRSSKPLMSVPNLTDFVSTLPTPVLTPIECTRLVYLDSDEENDLQVYTEKSKNKVNLPGTPLSPGFKSIHEEFEPKQEGFRRYQSDSYTSHLVTLGHQDNVGAAEWKTGIPKSASAVRFKKHLEEIADESTSDYCSIETMNRVSSSSNYSQSPGDPGIQGELINDYPEAKFGRSTNNSMRRYSKDMNSKDMSYGFSNPNYLGPDLKQNYAKMLNSPPDSVLEDAMGRSVSRNFQETVEMRNINRPKTVDFKTSKQVRSPPHYLPLRGSPYNPTTIPLSSEKKKKSRASSASRAERQANFTSYIQESLDEELSGLGLEPAVPLYVFVIGGKEHGQVTIFKRPISVWKLQLSSSVY